MNRIDEQACKRLNVSVLAAQYDFIECEANKTCAGNKSYLLRLILADYMKRKGEKR